MTGRSFGIALRCCALGMFILPCDAQGQASEVRDRLWSATGSPEDRLGYSVAAAGDVDGDGIPDVIAGAPQNISWLNPTGPGFVRVYSGADGSSIHEKSGAVFGDAFGGSVAGVGDLNLDGRDDFAVGAFQSDYGRGAVFLYSGIDGSILRRLLGTTTSGLGRAVSRAGDVDQDGYPDFIVGATSHISGHVEFARVYSGRDWSILHSFSIGSPAQSAIGFGDSVASAGDVDRDGVPDILVGAPLEDGHGLNSGTVYVFSGRNGTVLHRIQGESARDYLGRSVCPTGDLDGDGYDDFMIGAPQPMILTDLLYGPSGYAWVISGKRGQILHVLRGEMAGQQFGQSLGSVGDLDGDSINDLLVGTPAHPDGGFPVGGVRVFSGANGSLIARHDGGVGSTFGYSVAGLGDLDGDGVPDCVVGAPGTGPGVQVFSGKLATSRVPSPANNFSPVRIRSNVGSPGSFLGWSTAAAGDVNADGSTDVVVGAPDAGLPGGGAEGNVRVYSGLDGSLLHSFWGTRIGDRLGTSVNGAGDVNGDGHDDLIAGVGHILDGYAIVLSGATGQVLHTFWGSSYDFFGLSVAGAGDVNLDGFADVIVGAPQNESYHPGFGYAVAFSGADGSVLHSWTGCAVFSGLGQGVAAAGDVDADGFPDLLVSESGWDSHGCGYPDVRVFSGSTGAELYSIESSPDNLISSESIAGVGDLNLDGFDDFAIGDQYQGAYTGYCTTGDAPPGGTRAFSGRTGREMFRWSGEESCAGFGRSVSSAGDIDMDGHPDVMVGAPRPEAGQFVRLYSGRDGSQIGSIEEPTLPAFGISVAGLGDIDLDGHPEVAVGTIRNASGNYSGSLEIYSLWPGVSSFGHGSFGPNGHAPELTVTGCPLPGNTLSARIQRGVDASIATLRLGSWPSDRLARLECGELLWPATPIGTVTLVGSGPGGASGTVQFVIPSSTPSGTEIFLQASVHEPPQLKIRTFTNGVRVVVQ